MAILLQYNDQTKWSVQQLVDNTGENKKFIPKFLVIILSNS